MTERLVKTGFSQKPNHGWMFVTDTIIAAHRDVAVRIYP
jgi:hypothetical protein